MTRLYGWRVIQAATSMRRESPSRYRLLVTVGSTTSTFSCDGIAGV